MSEMLAINIFVKGEEPNTFLAVRRGLNDDLFPNMFALPGGGVNDNEEIVEAGKREFFEETGAELEHIDVIPSMELVLSMKDFVLRIKVHKGVLKAGSSFSPQDDDIQYVTWVKPGEFIESILEHDYLQKEVVKFKEFLQSQNIAIE